jgi:hypothetical protein
VCVVVLMRDIRWGGGLSGKAGSCQGEFVELVNGVVGGVHWARREGGGWQACLVGMISQGRQGHCVSRVETGMIFVCGQGAVCQKGLE